MSSGLIILITGANQGIGYEAAKFIAETSAHNHIIVGSRDLEKGEAAVSEIQSSGTIKSTLSAVQLDVTSQASIDTAVGHVQSAHGSLDVLVNNAAISVRTGSTVQRIRDCLETNVIGAVAVTEAFLPLLRASKKTRRVIFTTSGLGVPAMIIDPSPFANVYAPGYQSSKGALNILAILYARELGKEEMKVFALSPGFLATNLSGDPEGMRKLGAGEPAEGGKTTGDAVLGRRDADHGKHIYEGGVFPW